MGMFRGEGVVVEIEGMVGRGLGEGEMVSFGLGLDLRELVWSRFVVEVDVGGGLMMVEVCLGVFWECIEFDCEGVNWFVRV